MPAPVRGYSGKTPLCFIIWTHFSPDSGGLNYAQIPNPHEVVSGRGKREHPAHAVQSPKSCLTLLRHGLHPSEDFLYAFAFSLAYGVAVMMRRASINGAAPVRIVLRDMRRDLPLPQCRHEASGVVAAITAQRNPLPRRFV